ncbi:sigma-70 family RNA polymerase sigma factor [Hymenobacter sp. UYCo722]|uniref:RNA polymerase sigma factor n=1 Tax=Hymenobacter sp. UYCo722 TaxID=3156335 RepID=UPI003393401D
MKEAWEEFRRGLATIVAGACNPLARVGIPLPSAVHAPAICATNLPSYAAKLDSLNCFPGRHGYRPPGVSAATWFAFGADDVLPDQSAVAPRLTASRSSAIASPPTEAELIDGCLRGRQLAQKLLYDKYAGKMMAVCLRYAQTTFEAEDVLQEGFVTVFRTLGSFRRECPLEFWIRRIMINAALRQHRRNASLVAVSDGDYPETLSSEEFTLSNFNFQELLAMVQELAPRYRMVFNLYAIEGYTHKEIGELLTISEGTSKSQYSRARVILQTKLERLNAPTRHVR